MLPVKKKTVLQFSFRSRTHLVVIEVLLGKACLTLSRPRTCVWMGVKGLGMPRQSNGGSLATPSLTEFSGARCMWLCSTQIERPVRPMRQWIMPQAFENLDQYKPWLFTVCKDPCSYLGISRCWCRASPWLRVPVYNDE